MITAGGVCQEVYYTSTTITSWCVMAHRKLLELDSAIHRLRRVLTALINCYNTSNYNYF